MEDDYVAYVPEDDYDVWKRERRQERRIRVVNILTIVFVAIMAITALICIFAKNGLLANWH